MVTGYGKYVVPILFAALLLLSVMIVRPFIVPLLVSAVITYIFFPVVRWVQKLVRNRTLASVIVALIILLLITIPIVMIVNTVSREAYGIYLNSRTFIAQGDVLGSCDLALCTTLKDWLGDSNVRLYLERGTQAAITYLLENASEFIKSIPRRVVEVFITFFAVFYLLRDGDRIAAAMQQLIVTTYGKKQHIITRFNEVMYAVVYGALLIAFIQGFLGAVGFAIFGISSPITWGIAMFFLALIPYVGTGIIWVPAALILVISGVTGGQPALAWKGVGLLLYGFLLIGSIDNILKPRIIGGRARVHPVLVLVGTLGGLAFMGIAGIVVGPVILAMMVTFIELYVGPKTTQK